jgi:hypothetical protein
VARIDALNRRRTRQASQIREAQQERTLDRVVDAMAGCAALDLHGDPDTELAQQ